MRSKSFIYSATAVLTAGALGLATASVAFAATPLASSPSISPANNPQTIVSAWSASAHRSLPVLTDTQRLEVQTAISEVQNNPEVTQLVTKLRSLKIGESFRLSTGVAPLTVTKTSDGYAIEGIYEYRSVCGWTIATVLYGGGSIALFALAATLGPGEVAVIAGVEMTAEQLGFAAATSGSISALAAWADSKFCS
ncbi:hypothetical protein [Arcanobacterium phocae]|uniref:hypothetical protein n=1 Tax=Arcanobacterium phocae TaxID=131112 RepID=UPI001C0EAE3E|nr:hypothetical protein [Arcanobacterium phocae]